jgi:hypothetical protein
MSVGVGWSCDAFCGEAHGGLEAITKGWVKVEWH